jgi:hypothetical protein
MNSAGKTGKTGKAEEMGKTGEEVGSDGGEENESSGTTGPVAPPSSQHNAWEVDPSLNGAGCIGIDLGTTNSAVAVWQPSRNRVQIIPDLALGTRPGQPRDTTPSLVALDAPPASAAATRR